MLKTTSHIYMKKPTLKYYQINGKIIKLREPLKHTY